MLRTTAIALACLLALPAAAQSVTDKIDGLTANQGLYGNRIPDRTFTRAFTEICITGGGVLFDQNEAGDSTQGGACRPLMKGWVIERFARSAERWSDARIACTIEDMRLPEPLEWQYSCFNAEAFGLDDILINGEWVSNAGVLTSDTQNMEGVAAFLFGPGTCGTANRGLLGRQDGGITTASFRCVR